MKLLYWGIALVLVGLGLYWLFPDTLVGTIATLIGSGLTMLGLRDGSRPQQEFEAREKPRVADREKLSKEAELHRKRAEEAEHNAIDLDNLRAENRKNIEEASRKRKEAYEKFQEKRDALDKSRGTSHLLADDELRERFDKLRAKLNSAPPRKTNR